MIIKLHIKTISIVLQICNEKTNWTSLKTKKIAAIRLIMMCQYLYSLLIKNVFLLLSIKIAHSSYVLTQEDANSQMILHHKEAHDIRKLSPNYVHKKASLYYINDQDLIKPYVIPSSFSKEFTVQVNRTTEYIFEYAYNTSLIEVRKKVLIIYLIE